MKKFPPILILISCVLTSYGQDISNKYPGLIARVKKVNKDKSLSKISLENEEFMDHLTDGGGELTGLYKNDQIQKVIRKVFLSNGIEQFDYYFADGKLIFIYETFRAFKSLESQGTFDYSKTEIEFIGRYYFQNTKLVDSETTGHNRFEDDTIDIEKTLIAEMTDCLEHLNIKRK